MSRSTNNYPEITPEHFFRMLTGEYGEDKSGRDDLLRRIEYIKSASGSDTEIAEIELNLISSAIDKFSARFDPVICNRLILYIKKTGCLSDRATANLLMDRIIRDNDLPNNGRAVLFEYYLRDYVNTLDSKKYKKFVKSDWLKTFSKLEHSMPLLYAEICLLSGHFDKAKETILDIAEDKRSHIDILTQIKVWLNASVFKENTRFKKWLDGLAIALNQVLKNSENQNLFLDIFESNNIRTGDNVIDLGMRRLNRITDAQQVRTSG